MAAIQSLLFLTLLYIQTVGGVKVSDCIAKKYYYFSTDHTACVLKSAGADTSGVSEEDRQLIVDKHNQLRAQETAADMQEMVWDDEIAEIAQRWADNCLFEHDAMQRIPGRFSLGQNLAAGYTTWDSAIQGWYDEVKDFTYGSQAANVFSEVGHYTQLVWASSAKIGCGYTYCSTLANYHRLYVCNYGPAGNLDWSKPYRQGSKCADCPDQCSDEGLCDCGGKVCQNGGTLDLNTCECSCSQNWHLLQHDCALNCSAVKESSSCAPGGFYDGKCFVYSNVPDECPKACNICPYSDYLADEEEIPEESVGVVSTSNYLIILLSAAAVRLVRLA